jgi:hypothetical protein
MGIAWSLPSLAIIWVVWIMDRFGRLRARREAYLVLAGVLTATAWTALPFVRRADGPWLGVTLALGVASVLITASVRGALAEIGQSTAATGRLAAGVFGAGCVGSLLQIPIQTQLSQQSLEWTAGVGAALGVLLALWAIMSLAKARPPLPATVVPASQPASPRLRDYLRSRTFWALLSLGALASIGGLPDRLVGNGPAPAPVFFAIPDELRMRVYLLGSAATLSAALAYFLACSRLPPRTLVPGAFLLAALGTLALIPAHGVSPALEIGITARTFGSVLTTLALLDLALRAAPAGYEATGATITIGLPTVVLVLVSALAVRGRFPFSISAAIAAGAFLVGIVAVRLVPALLLQARDGDAPR